MSTTSKSTSHLELPESLPNPLDDGACEHLLGMRIPSVELRSTDDSQVNLATLQGTIVVYCYPRTGQHNQPSPEGWNDTPGACGCTPQSCSFKNNFHELKELGVDHLFGLSTQDTGYQREAVARLHLPFQLLSDFKFQFIEALKLPTFEFAHFGTLVKRLTLIIRDGKIVKVFYPVFPPDQNPESIINWLRSSVN